MSLAIHADPAPLRTETDGTVRVGATRVTLDLVMEANQRGLSPEAIVETYPSLQLADVHGVLAYYFRHRAEVDGYLQERQRQADALRRTSEAAQPDRATLRERLQNRLAKP